MLKVTGRGEEREGERHQMGSGNCLFLPFFFFFSFFGSVCIVFSLPPCSFLHSSPAAAGITQTVAAAELRAALLLLYLQLRFLKHSETLEVEPSHAQILGKKRERLLGLFLVLSLELRQQNQNGLFLSTGTSMLGVSGKVERGKMDAGT